MSDPSPTARARPLFSPTRRPPPPPAADVVAPIVAPVAPVTPPPNVTLTGVVIGTTTVALVRHGSDASATTIGLGAAIDGWTVAEIRPRAIVLRRDDRRVTIALPDPSH